MQHFKLQMPIPINCCKSWRHIRVLNSRLHDEQDNLKASSMIDFSSHFLKETDRLTKLHSNTEFTHRFPEVTTIYSSFLNELLPQLEKWILSDQTVFCAWSFTQAKFCLKLLDYQFTSCHFIIWLNFDKTEGQHQKIRKSIKTASL